MIVDKIKFKPGYAKEDSKTFASAGVEVKGLTPDRIWRNLTNISTWPRFNDQIVDIDFVDSADNDPHLFDKAQFYFNVASGFKVQCQIICFTPPKEDRTARLAIQGTVFDSDGAEVNDLVIEAIVGVPDNNKREILDLEAAFSCKNEVPDAASANYGDMLESTLSQLVNWSEKHK